MPERTPLRGEVEKTDAGKPAEPHTAPTVAPYAKNNATQQKNASAQVMLRTRGYPAI